MLKELIAVLMCSLSQVNSLNFTYHNYNEMTKLLKEWNTTAYHPRLRTNLYSIGKSIQGRELWVMQLTAGLKNVTSLPNVKLIGNMHGNEVVGREILLQYIEYLLLSYTNNVEITWLLDNTKLHIMPSMNPDGFEKATSDKVETKAEEVCFGEVGRGNGIGVDLNRNFPDKYRPNREPIQTETVAMMKWMKKTPFILSAALHGGLVLANYPYDTQKVYKSFGGKNESLTPDNDVFIYLAKTYANNHINMHEGVKCENRKDTFEGGIVNGARWYSFTGSMQDYNYFKHGCMELTLEISCCKYPKAGELEELWNANQKALTKYCLQANQGITGVVTDKNTKQPLKATLKLLKENITFNSTSKGRYWKILLPGTYTMLISVKGYHSKRFSFEIPLQEPNKYPKLIEFSFKMINSSIPISTTTSKSTTNLSTSTRRHQKTTEGAIVKKSAMQPGINEIPVTGAVRSFSPSIISNKRNIFSYILLMRIFFYISANNVM